MDTLQAAKALQSVGFNESQAEALVHAIGEAVNDSVATKTDILNLRTDFEKSLTGLRTDFEKSQAEVRSDFEKSRAEVRADIQGLRAELYRAMAVQTVASIAAVGARLKFM